MDSSNCYLFSKAGFFQGYPPQECVTRHFIEARDEMGYTTFPVFRKYGRYWDFLDWDDPEAEAVWKPYVDEGKHVDPDELEDELTPEQEEARETDIQLFAYYAAQADSSSYAYCSEDTDDPIMCFNKLVSGPFNSDAFASELDRCVWTYMSQSDMPMTDQSFSILANDVATSNLQLLTKRSSDEELMVHDQRSVPLTKSIYANLQQKQSTKNKLHFLDYLARINDEARSEIYQYKSLATALLHLPDNTIVDMDDANFDRFAAFYHPSTLDILPNFLRYLDKRKVKREKIAKGFATLASKPSATITYEDYLDRMHEYFDDPGEGLAHITSFAQVAEAIASRTEDLSDSTVSPEYAPSSPKGAPPFRDNSPEVDYDFLDDPMVITGAAEKSSAATKKKPLPITNPSEIIARRTRSSDKGKQKEASLKKLSKQEFLHCLILLVSFCMYTEQDFNPSQKFCDNFGFRACLDFARRFRLRYKLYYISFGFRASICNDVEKFVSNYVKRKYGPVPFVEVLGR